MHCVFGYGCLLFLMNAADLHDSTDALASV